MSHACDQVRAALVSGQDAEVQDCAECTAFARVQARLGETLAKRRWPEPSLGFEARVITMALARRRRRWVRLVPFAAAAALAAGFVWARWPRDATSPRPGASVVDVPSQESVVRDMADLADVQGALDFHARWDWVEAPLLPLSITLGGMTP